MPICFSDKNIASSIWKEDRRQPGGDDSDAHETAKRGPEETWIVPPRPMYYFSRQLPCLPAPGKGKKIGH